MSRVTIAKQEFVSLKLEKTILLAIIIQLFIAGFSSFLLVGLVTLYDPGAPTGSTVEFGVTGEATERLVEAVDSEGPWSTTRFEGESSARENFQQGRVDAVFLASYSDTGQITVEVIVPAESIQSTVTVVHVREALKVLEEKERVANQAKLTQPPLSIPELPQASPTYGFTYTVLLPLLVFLPIFISGSIALDSFTEELETGTLELLLVTPLQPSEIIDGKLIPPILLIPIQVLAWLVLLMLNGSTIANPIELLIYATSVGSIIVCLGVTLAIGLEKRQSAQLVYSLGVIAVFLLGSLLPEGPPNIIAKLAMASQTTTTHGLVVGHFLLALIVVFVVRTHIAEFLHPDR